MSVLGGDRNGCGRSRPCDFACGHFAPHLDRLILTPTLIDRWYCIKSWVQDAAIKIGSALPSPTTSSMRDFGASRDERRPDVRFCGLGAAVEEWARADRR